MDRGGELHPPKIDETLPLQAGKQAVSNQRQLLADTCPTTGELRRGEVRYVPEMKMRRRGRRGAMISKVVGVFIIGCNFSHYYLKWIFATSCDYDKDRV